MSGFQSWFAARMVAVAESIVAGIGAFPPGAVCVCEEGRCQSPVEHQPPYTRYSNAHNSRLFIVYEVSRSTVHGEVQYNIAYCSVVSQKLACF